MASQTLNCALRAEHEGGLAQSPGLPTRPTPSNAAIFVIPAQAGIQYVDATACLCAITIPLYVFAPLRHRVKIVGASKPESRLERCGHGVSGSFNKLAHALQSSADCTRYYTTAEQNCTVKTTPSTIRRIQDEICLSGFGIEHQLIYSQSNDFTKRTKFSTFSKGVS